MSQETQFIFGSEQYAAGVAWHNVGGVLRGAKPEVSSGVAAHYGKRAGHIPNAKQIGVLVSDASDVEVQAQMHYQSRIIGKSISVVPLDHGPVTEKTLAVPYINTPQAEATLRDLGMDVWGLPSQMVHRLKNKATCHQLITEAGIENFVLPDYTICPVEDIPQVGQKLLQETQEQYAKTGMLGYYPLGIMARTAESDGNYGAAIIVEKPDGIHILPDGKATDQKIVSDWPTALAAASTLLASTLNLQVENRVVLSRLMDLADSPGESVIILNGNVTSLGWNGQVKEPGSSACVGTSSYQPSTWYLREIHEQQEQSHTTALIQFLQFVAQTTQIDFSTVNGVANVDWMIPGPLENTFQHRLGKQPCITVAEINPRFTNWTDAILLAMWATGLEQTVSSMQSAIKGRILTIDKLAVPLPPAASFDAVRDSISDLDHRLQNSHGSRVILRMPDKPNMGVIFTGNIDFAREQTENLVRSL